MLRLSPNRLVVALAATALISVFTNPAGAHEVPSSNGVVSVDPAGIPGAGPSTSASVSSDGNLIAFTSDADGLVAGDFDGQSDVFIRDVATGTTSIPFDLSLPVRNVHISGDGNVLAVEAYTQDPLAGPPPRFYWEVWSHDRTTGVTTQLTFPCCVCCSDDKAVKGLSADGSRIAIFNNELGGNPEIIGGPSLPPTPTQYTDVAISGDGNYAAVTEFVQNTSGGGFTLDVVLIELATGTKTNLSVGPNGVEANAQSLAPRLDDDASTVIYESDATNLVTGDTNGLRDVFVVDVGSLTTTRVSVDSTGAQADGPSRSGVISSSGNDVAFLSDATNLVGSDTNGVTDVFHHNTFTGWTDRASETDTGVETNAAIERPEISGDGETIVFDADGATALAAGASGQQVFLSLEPLPLVTPGAAAIIEGDVGSQIVNWPIHLDRPHDEPITVTGMTFPNPGGLVGIATDGLDFIGGAGTVTIPAGTTTLNVPITILGDTIVEPPLWLGEWLIIQVTAVSPNAELNMGFFGLGIVIIVDDD